MAARGGGGGSGGGGGWHGGGSGWHGGGSGWHGGGLAGRLAWWWLARRVLGLRLVVGWRGVVATSPWWGWPYWWNAPYYGGMAAYPAYSTTTTTLPDPVVYVEQSQPSAPAMRRPCPGRAGDLVLLHEPAGYYPYVQSCSKPWMRVVPDATQPPPALHRSRKG